MSDNIKVLLVGCGYMGKEYTKVLKDYKVDFVVVGNSERGTNDFFIDSGIRALSGGLSNYLSNNKYEEAIAIVATPIDTLADNTIYLIKSGYKRILLEKPGALNKTELKGIRDIADDYNAKVYIGYNRRFYASVNRAEKIIIEDGGVTSFNFEFTEWADNVKNSGNKEEVLERWLLANSTHVIDLAFYLGGYPTTISSYITDALDWHSSGAIYSGAGHTDKGGLFSYQANWKSPGRWSVEILTNKHRLIFRPLEKLQIQKLNSVNIEYVDIDDKLDREYKPGLYKEVEAFISNINDEKLVTLDEQIKFMEIYEKIAGVC